MRNKYFRIILLLTGLFITSGLAAQQQRFPKPEFESGYVQPSPTTPEPRAWGMEYFDVFVLVAALLVISWFIFKSVMAD